MQVCVAGISYSNDVSFRTWSGGRWGTRTSDVQTLSAGNSGVGFSKTITLTQAVSGADAVDTYGKITLCPPSGQSIKDLEITSVYYKPVVIQERPELEDGEIDLSTIQGSSGCWDPVNYQVNINDTQEAYSWYNLRENVASGETVTVRMIGEWSGNNGFRVWIGNGHSTFCTEALSGQTYKKFDSSNLEKGEFDETFQFTATGGCDYLTVKCISGSCIDGLVIKRIIVTKD